MLTGLKHLNLIVFEQHLHQDRLRGADRTGLQERHPDRGVRPRPRGRGAGLCRGCDRGRPAAPAADHDDQLRVHRRRHPGPDARRALHGLHDVLGAPQSRPGAAGRHLDDFLAEARDAGSAAVDRARHRRRTVAVAEREAVGEHQVCGQFGREVEDIPGRARLHRLRRDQEGDVEQHRRDGEQVEPGIDDEGQGGNHPSCGCDLKGHISQSSSACQPQGRTHGGSRGTEDAALRQEDISYGRP